MTHSFRPYAPRSVRFCGLAESDGYRIKRYEIVYAGPFREGDFAQGLRLAFE